MSWTLTFHKTLHFSSRSGKNIRTVSVSFLTVCGGRGFPTAVNAHRGCLYWGNLARNILVAKSKYFIFTSETHLWRPDCHASESSGWPHQPAVPGEAQGLCPLSRVWLWELEDWYLLGHPSCNQTLRSQPGLRQCGMFLYITFMSKFHILASHQGCHDFTAHS